MEQSMQTELVQVDEDDSRTAVDVFDNLKPFKMGFGAVSMAFEDGFDGASRGTENIL
jgi:hypothetical protein